MTARGPLPHVRLGGVKVATASRRELTEAMVADCRAARHAPGSRPPTLVFDANGHALSLAKRNADYRRALEAADIVHADGGFLVPASRRFAGAPIAERSATTDLFHDFARAAVEEGLSFYLLGGTEAVNARCAVRMQELYPRLRLAGRRDGYFAIGEEEAVVAEIARASPDILWIGLGKPKEQLFAVRHRDRLAARWAVTCGGCFNYVTGHYRRAPRWMQRLHLEWLHRALTNPALLGRYLTTSPHALWLVERNRDREYCGPRAKVKADLPTVGTQPDIGSSGQKEALSSTLISVVLPVYNRADRILPALRSVQLQEQVNLECIVVDDGSDDGNELKATVDAIDDARFRYVRRLNGGGGAARNTGIEAARGEFIAFLDSDDTFVADKLEKDLRFLLNAPESQVVYSQVRADRGDGRSVVKPCRGPKLHEDMSDYLTRAQGFVPTPTITMPTALARQVRYDEGLPFGQDTDFAIRLGAAGATFYMRPEIGAVVDDRIDPTRLSQQRNVEPVLEWLERIRPQMTERAWYAYRGWHVARLFAATDKLKALRYYFSALFHGAFPPGLAVVALVQIIVPRSIYRKFAPSR